MGKHFRHSSFNRYVIETNNRFRRFSDDSNKIARRFDFCGLDSRNRIDGFPHV